MWQKTKILVQLFKTSVICKNGKKRIEHATSFLTNWRLHQPYLSIQKFMTVTHFSNKLVVGEEENFSPFFANMLRQIVCKNIPPKIGCSVLFAF